MNVTSFVGDRGVDGFVDKTDVAATNNRRREAGGGDSEFFQLVRVPFFPNFGGLTQKSVIDGLAVASVHDHQSALRTHRR